MDGENAGRFLQDIRTVKHDPVNLMIFEKTQEDRLYAAEDDLCTVVQNRSRAPQTIIKLYEERLTRHLLLQHVTGLFINKTNMKEIEMKKLQNAPNRYKKLFLEDDIEIEFLEHGKIMFLYEQTPAGDGDAAASFDDADLQSFYILLIPKANEKVDDNDDVEKRLFKIIKKRLPDVKDKFSWMLVKNFNNDIKGIQEERDGKLIIKPDNIIGKGQYSMENSEHNEQYCTTIKYDLEVSAEIGFFQNKFQITKGDSFYIMVLNPIVTMSSSGRPIEFPEKTQNCFKPSYRWSQGHPDMMNIEGCEMLLINGSIVNVQQLMDQLDSETIGEIDSEKEEKPDFERRTIS